MHTIRHCILVFKSNCFNIDSLLFKYTFKVHAK